MNENIDLTKILKNCPESIKLYSSMYGEVLFRDINNYIDSSSLMSNSVLGKIAGVDNIGKLTDIIVEELPISYTNKLKYLNETNPISRIKLLIEDLKKEIEALKVIK